MIEATAEIIRQQIQRRIRERAPVECRDCRAPVPVSSELNAYGSHWSVGTLHGAPVGCMNFVLRIVGEVMAEYELVE